MGWDNIEMGELVKPTLTTISPDHLELSRIMVMQLEKMVHKQDENNDVWEVGVELIKRESTKNSNSLATGSVGLYARKKGLIKSRP